MDIQMLSPIEMEYWDSNPSAREASENAVKKAKLYGMESLSDSERQVLQFGVNALSTKKTNEVSGLIGGVASTGTAAVTAVKSGLIPRLLKGIWNNKKKVFGGLTALGVGTEIYRRNFGDKEVIDKNIGNKYGVKNTDTGTLPNPYENSENVEAIKSDTNTQSKMILNDLDAVLGNLLKMSNQYSDVGDVRAASINSAATRIAAKKAVDIATTSLATVRAAGWSIAANPNNIASALQNAQIADNAYSVASKNLSEIDGHMKIIGDPKVDMETKRLSAYALNEKSGVPVESVIRDRGLALQAMSEAKGILSAFLSSKTTTGDSVKVAAEARKQREDEWKQNLETVDKVVKILNDDSKLPIKTLTEPNKRSFQAILTSVLDKMDSSGSTEKKTNFTTGGL